MSEPMTLQEILKEFRGLRKWSARQMAEWLGVPLSTYKYWEYKIGKGGISKAGLRLIQAKILKATDDPSREEVKKT